MKLDETFVRELKVRESLPNLNARLRAVSKMLSTTKAPALFTDALRIHGRAAVGICVAATIWDRREHMTVSQLAWALAVLSASGMWTHLDGKAINDGLHPTRIIEPSYAGEFMRLTTEEMVYL